MALVAVRDWVLSAPGVVDSFPLDSTVALNWAFEVAGPTLKLTVVCRIWGMMVESPPLPAPLICFSTSSICVS